MSHFNSYAKFAHDKQWVLIAGTRKKPRDRSDQEMDSERAKPLYLDLQRVMVGVYKDYLLNHPEVLTHPELLDSVHFVYFSQDQAIEEQVFNRMLRFLGWDHHFYFNLQEPRAGALLVNGSALRQFVQSLDPGTTEAIDPYEHQGRESRLYRSLHPLEL